MLINYEHKKEFDICHVIFVTFLLHPIYFISDICYYQFVYNTTQSDKIKGIKMFSMKKLLIIFLSLTIIVSLVTQIDIANADETTDEATATLEPILLKKGSEGDDVIMLQLRLKDLGYYNYKITNYFGSFTEQALIDFQKVNKLSRDGVLGEDTYSIVYSNDAKRKPIEVVVQPTPKPQYAGSSKIPKAALKDWFTYVLPRFSRGETVKVYDVKTNFFLVIFSF